jgi:hypothetical protein
VTFLTSTRNDCGGCADGARLTGIALAVEETGTELRVRLAAEPAVGTRLWLWLEREPHQPVLLELSPGGWVAAIPALAPFGLAELGIRESGRVVGLFIEGMRTDEGIAVVSDGGDRMPAAGYATAAGAEERSRAAGGRLADDIADDIAAVQSGFPGLDTEQQALTQLTLARQVTTGTFRYELGMADRPELRLVAEVSVRFPEVSQRLFVELEGELVLAQTILVLADGITVCTWMTDGSADCGPAESPLPVTGLVGLVREPDSVDVRRSAAREVADGVAGCWRVARSIAGGPPEGESCALDDGVLAVNDNQRAGHLIVLAERSDAVSEAAFSVP